jgi:hypothetical protein
MISPYSERASIISQTDGPGGGGPGPLGYVVFEGEMGMQVGFSKVDEGRLCAWTATCPKRRLLQGTTMASGRDLPHDLAQFVVESTLGLHHGFWGLLANGATFESVRRRRTKPGQQVIRRHHGALMATERVVNAHVTAWRTGTTTPAGSALDAMPARWRALPVGEELRAEWTTRRLPGVTGGGSRRRLK